MTVKITDTMLYAVCSGGVPHTPVNVHRVRRILTEAGVGDVELHRVEIEEITDLRKRAAGFLERAREIEDRGPMPVEEEAEALSDGT
jgi:hypothetical protein